MEGSYAAARPEARHAPDGSVVAQAQAGDREAFRVLVERHSRSIFRVAYRMTGNEQDAEDVVQETFLRAYSKLNRFEARAQFATWLHRIAVNCALDMMRLRRRHEEQRETGAPEGPDPTLEVAATTPAADRLLLSAEVHERVAAALARLSPMERATFVLRHFEGQSIDEIARALGLRSGAAKNSIFRAVAKLRRELEPLLGSPR